MQADISNTEAILFSKSKPQNLASQLPEIRLHFGGQAIAFSKEATRWLGIWLDSRLNFHAHFNERIKSAKAAEARIKSLCKVYGLCPALVRRIQVAAVQSVALYGSELWWKGQKNHQQVLQKLFNRQARLITGLYQSTPIASLMSESGLTPAHILLDFRQRRYAYRILSLPDNVPTKSILSHTLRIEDGNDPPGEQPEDDLYWITGRRIRTYGQYLARQVLVNFSIDPAEGVEPILEPSTATFPGNIVIEEKIRQSIEPKRRRRTLYCGVTDLREMKAERGRQ